MISTATKELLKTTMSKFKKNMSKLKSTKNEDRWQPKVNLNRRGRMQVLSFLGLFRTDTLNTPVTFTWESKGDNIHNSAGVSTVHISVSSSHAVPAN